MYSGPVQDFLTFVEREALVILASEINSRLFGDAETTMKQRAFVDSVLADSVIVLLRSLERRYARESSTDHRSMLPPRL